MPTKSQQVLPRLSERAVKIELRNRAAGSLALVARERDQHCRSSEFFDQSRSDDTDHSWMPVVVGQNDREHFVEVHRQDFFAGLLQCHAIYVLAPLIQLLQLAGNRVGLVLILCEQQLHSPNRVPEPARRIEPGRQYEPDSAGRELLSIETGGPQQRAHSDVAGVRQHLETVADEYAIFATERRDVRNRRQCDKIEHRPDEVVVGAELAGESERELEGDADGGEVLVRISVAGPLGIENREAIRQLTARKVVVGDDDVDSRSAEPRDGSNGASAAVTRDHDPGFRRDRRVDSGIAQVISVLDAPGNERRCLPAQLTDHPRENGRGADAVDIVVAMDEDGLLLPNRAREALDGFVHREKAERIVQPI